MLRKMPKTHFHLVHLEWKFLHSAFVEISISDPKFSNGIAKYFAQKSLLGNDSKRPKLHRFSFSLYANLKFLRKMR